MQLDSDAGAAYRPAAQNPASGNERGDDDRLASAPQSRLGPGFRFIAIQEVSPRRLLAA
jgi:hypothetical protein